MSQVNRNVETEIFGGKPEFTDSKQNKQFNENVRQKIKLFQYIYITDLQILDEYCTTSTIHGVHYITDRKRPVFERIFWICTVLFSIFWCVRFMYDAWHKWEENPVIINFNEKSSYVWDIPFPAVTICPEIKTRRKIFNYTHMCNIARTEGDFEMSDIE